MERTAGKPQTSAMSERSGNGGEAAALSFLRQRIRSAELPEYVMAAAEYELQRIGSSVPMSPEYGLARGYIDWLLALPWRQRSDDRLDVRRVQAELDAGHYGLDAVKAQILDFVGVMARRKDGQAPALCFVGPVGAGKTSLGHSIARALDRKFVSMSVAGVRDEAELDGRRRTWPDALPGRVIRAIRNAGTRNPVFVIEGIDRLDAEGRAGLSAVLYEVLDLKARARFTDHYLDLPFDLREAMFIATANLEEAIPEVLRECVEVIHLPGYVQEEKLAIAREYLLPRERERSGLTEAEFDIDEWALKSLIGEYTVEAGVRHLQRRIATLARHAAGAITAGKISTWRVGRAELAECFGPSAGSDDAVPPPEVGAARNLLVSADGGIVSVVEVTRIRGAGQITMTGPVDERMREHVLTALTAVRARAERYDLDPNVFDETQLHVHFNQAPAASDIASEGLAIAAALVSTYTGKPIRFDLTLTGGLSLRGRVLPVSGIVDKVLAARRADIRHIVIPRENQADLQQLPAYVTSAMQFHPVETVDQALELAMLQIIVPKPEETSAIEMFKKGKPDKPANGS